MALCLNLRHEIRRLARIYIDDRPDLVVRDAGVWNRRT